MTKNDYLKSIQLVGEEWRFIPDYGEKYAASSLGRIVSFKQRNPKLLTIVPQKTRGKTYSHVCLNRKKVRVHRLIAQVFLPNPQGYNEVDHINNNSQDNRACNLRWCSHRENMRNPNTRETQREYRLSHPFEIDERGYPRNVDTTVFFNRHEDKMKAIVQIKDGVEIARYKSLGEAQRAGYKKTSISAVINGRLKTYRGYEWRLINAPDSPSNALGLSR